MDSLRHLNDVVREYIDDHFLKIGVLSDKCDIEREKLYRMLTRCRKPQAIDAISFIKICRVLEVNPNDFIDEAERRANDDDAKS